MIDLSPTQRSEKQSNSVQNLAIFVLFVCFFFCGLKEGGGDDRNAESFAKFTFGDLTPVARFKLGVCPSRSETGVK